jgi:hypothetical protein
MEQEYHALSRALLNIFCIPLKEQYHKSVIKFHVLYRARVLVQFLFLKRKSRKVGVFANLFQFFFIFKMAILHFLT